MHKKRFLAWALALVLLAGAVSALAASAGSAEDPFLSLSYLNGSYIDSMMNKARTAIESAFAPLEEELSESGAAAHGGFTPYLISAGGSVGLDTGGSVMLLSGEASLTIQNGAVVDVTSGREAAAGALTKNTRYLGAEDCDASVSVGTGAVVAVSGGAAVTGGTAVDNPFTDVDYGDWFYVDVAAAHGRGLIDGMSATSYAPGGPLTAAQAVKLAACLHQRYYTDEVTLENSVSGKWYRSYADYALQNGILTNDFTEAEYDKVISRTAFVALFYRALPASEYTVKNRVADGAIPDVAITDANAGEVYAFYRAGILTGSDVKGTFNPSSDIKRSEVAAILTRMYDAGSRKSVLLA